MKPQLFIEKRNQFFDHKSKYQQSGAKRETNNWSELTQTVRKYLAWEVDTLTCWPGIHINEFCNIWFHTAHTLITDDDGIWFALNFTIIIEYGLCFWCCYTNLLKKMKIPTITKPVSIVQRLQSQISKTTPKSLFTVEVKIRLTVVLFLSKCNKT